MQAPPPDLKKYFRQHAFAAVLGLCWGIPSDLTMAQIRRRLAGPVWFVTLNTESASYARDAARIRRDYPTLRQVQDVDDAAYYS